MKIVCEACSAKYSISDDKVRGKVFKIRCKKCSHIIVVRGQGDDAAGAAPVAEAAPAAAATSWYVVVDGEQVGPLSEADVQARLARGEINADSFAWREGLADWQKISAISELAGLLPAAGDAPAADEGPFSPAPTAVYPPGMAESVFSQNTPEAASVSAAAAAQAEDVFGAPTALTGAPQELFASPAAEKPAPASSRAPTPSPAAPSAFSFGAPAASAPAPAPSLFGNGASTATASPRVDALTGQRSENSVLFSLSNLEALAAPAPAPAAAAAAKPAAGPAPEGSGLIDIRAMAAMTLTPASAPAAAGGPSVGLGGGLPFLEKKDSDLPAFGTSSFSPVAPTLLPMGPVGGGTPKWVVPVLGIGVVLIGLVGFLGYKVLSREPVVVQSPVPAAPAPAAAVAPTPAAPAPTAAEPSATPPPAAATPPEALPPREGAAPVAAATSSDKGGKSSRSSSSGSKRSGSSGKSSEPAAAPVAAAPAPEPAKAAPAEPAKKRDALDDLLMGALGDKKKPAAPAPRVEESKPAAAASSSAGPLSKEAINAGMLSVRPKVKDCYNQFKVPGTAMVKVTVSPGGKVSDVKVEGKFAGTPTGSCVEGAVRQAKFPPSAGLQFPYPFQL